MRVLLAEHQKHARRLLAHLLGQHALEIIEAEDVESSLAQAAGRPRLALVDWRLPPEQGQALFSSLRARLPAGDVYLVAIVSSRVDDTHAAALAAGADDLLTLPAALDVVRRRLEEFVGAADRLATAPAVIAASVQGAKPAVLDFIDGPAFALDRHGVLQAVNQEFETLSGLPVDALQGLPGAVLGLSVTAANAGAATLLRPDGSALEVVLREIPIAINGHDLAVFACEVAAAAPQGNLAVVPAPGPVAARDMYLMFERGGAVRSVSQALAAHLGYDQADLAGADIRTLLHPDDVPKLRETLPRKGQAAAGAELRVRAQAGQWVPLRFTGRSAAELDGVDGFVLIVRTAADAAADPSELPDWVEVGRQFGALPDAPRLLKQLEALLSDPRQPAEMHGILLIRLLDDNSTQLALGDRSAEQMLVAAAQRLCRHVRSDDLLAQTSPGELAILARGIRDETGAVKIAERVLSDFRRRPLDLAGVAVTVSPSIGIALGTPGASHAAELLRHAEVALLRAGSSAAGYAVHRDVATRRATAQLGLDAELQRAIERDEFRVFYQPEVDLQDGSIMGVEALVRWQHPQRGLLLPRDFIPIAEESGAIQAIGTWVLERATHDVAEWQRQFDLDERFTVGVNFSDVQFRQAEVVEHVARALRRSGLPPISLRLEIAEELLTGQDTELLLVLDHLKALGLQLAVDNFGADFSASGYLRWLPASALKVERAFITSGRNGASRLSIVQSAASIARSSGMELVVEGIETGAELDRILELEVLRGQGFYFSRAVSRDTLGFLLAAGPQPFSALLQPAARE